MTDIELLERRRIDEFWLWFSKHISSIEDVNSNSILLNQLDQWVYELGSFSWELGPGLQEANAFILSPVHDSNKLEASKDIIDRAPQIANWEWHYAKPPKKFAFIVEIQNSDGSYVQVDGQSWLVAMLKYPDGKIELDILANNLLEFNQDFRSTAVDIMIESIIGEEYYITYLERINIVDGFEPRFRDALYTLKELRQKFEDEIKGYHN